MKRLLGLAMALGLGIGSLGFSQDIKVGGGLGYLIPSKDVKDSYGKSAIPFAGFVSYAITPQIDVVGEIGYYKVSGKEVNKPGFKDGTPTTFKCKDSLRVIPITASCLYNLPIKPNITGYVGAGAGVFMGKIEIEKPEGTPTSTLKTTEETKSPFGFLVRAGVIYSVSPNITIVGEARYMSATWKKEKDITKDLNIGGTVIGLGVAYNIPLSKKE